MSQTSEVIICTTCSGYGFIEKRITAYENDWVECDECNGKGRILKITTVTYEQIN